MEISKRKEKMWVGNVTIPEAEQILRKCKPIIVDADKDIATGDHIRFFAKYPNCRDHAISERIYTVRKIISEDYFTKVVAIAEIEGMEVDIEEYC